MSSTLCPPCTKPSTLNADRKVQNRGNARARVFKVRLICPAVVTKTRGAEAISAAASSACAALRSAAACVSRTCTRSGSENIPTRKDGRAGPTSSPSIRSQDPTFCTATNQDKFHECSVLSNGPFACDQQIGTHVLSSSNQLFACD